MQVGLEVERRTGHDQEVVRQFAGDLTPAAADLGVRRGTVLHAGTGDGEVLRQVESDAVEWIPVYADSRRLDQPLRDVRPVRRMEAANGEGELALAPPVDEEGGA